MGQKADKVIESVSPGHGSQTIETRQQRIFQVVFTLMAAGGILFWIFKHGSAGQTITFFQAIMPGIAIAVWTAAVVLKPIEFRTRAICGLAGIYLMAFAFVWGFNDYSAAGALIICTPLLAGLFFSIKPVLILVLINLVIGLGAWVLSPPGSITRTGEPGVSAGWEVYGVFFFISVLVAIAMVFFNRQILEKIREQQIEFEQERNRLENQLANAQKLKDIGLIAGAVAHDLNNILSGIATYPDVLLMNDDLDPQMKKGLVMIKSSGKAAADMISDLLAISRETKIKKEVININSVINQFRLATEYEQIQAIIHGLEIEFQTEPELIPIKASYIHIEKSLVNLIVNAASAAEKQRRPKVTVSTFNRYIHQDSRLSANILPGEYSVLRVQDNGGRIDPKTIEKLKTPFYIKKEIEKKGKGLGLILVFHAVLNHHGFMEVLSDEDGTRLDLYFPSCRRAADHDPMLLSIQDIKGNDEGVLVVDDDAHQRSIAKELLSGLGYRADAVDVRQAMDKLSHAESYDLIVLDMTRRAKNSGLETSQMIRNISPGQKIIPALGFEGEDVDDQDHGLETKSHVKKPYTILDMGIAIKEELGS